MSTPKWHRIFFEKMSEAKKIEYAEHNPFVQCDFCTKQYCSKKCKIQDWISNHKYFHPQHYIQKSIFSQKKKKRVYILKMAFLQKII